MGTAKSLPPNTSLILQAMANSLQTGTLLRLADSDMEVKIKASITKFTLSWFLFAKIISFSWYVINRVNFKHLPFELVQAICKKVTIILPAKSRSDVMFCLQSYWTYLS